MLNAGGRIELPQIKCDSSVFIIVKKLNMKVVLRCTPDLLNFFLNTG